MEICICKIFYENRRGAHLLDSYHFFICHKNWLGEVVKRLLYIYTILLKNQTRKEILLEELDIIRFLQKTNQGEFKKLAYCKWLIKKQNNIIEYPIRLFEKYIVKRRDLTVDILLVTPSSNWKTQISKGGTKLIRWVELQYLLG